MTETRPWGKFEILLDSEKSKVKRITVNPGGILSLQYHHKRSEHWVIVEGVATVTLNGKEADYIPGQSVYIPVTYIHRVENKGTTDLVFIEVQTGTYFGEDDIIRLEDKYDRK